MAYVKFDVMAELEKAVNGRKTKVNRYTLLRMIADALGLLDELKKR